MPANAPDSQRKMLTDPQTAGGLLVACDAAIVPTVLALFHDQGFKDAAAIGTLDAGAPSIVLS
jgi:selenide, water dikinase